MRYDIQTVSFSNALNEMKFNIYVSQCRVPHSQVHKSRGYQVGGRGFKSRCLAIRNYIECSDSKDPYRLNTHPVDTSF